MKENTTKARVPGGMRDLLPEQLRQRDWITQKVISVYEDFGFVPIETPTIEFKETLVGQGTDFNIFKIDSKTEGDPLALRFDLTVPLARVVCQYPEIPKPFKRYQFGHVFRGEKPQAGRYREFVQLDADIVGSSTPYADLEIVLIMHEVMKRLGIDGYKIRFNNRKILNALPEYANFERSKNHDVMRILDKIDKIGEDAVFAALREDKELFMTPYNCERIKKYLDFSQMDNTTILDFMKNEFSGITTAEEGIAELELISLGLDQAGITRDKWKIDPSIARGLAYYTGPVFETFLDDLPSIGSIFSGGRYDNLTERFSDIAFPATGASVGVDRLLTALIELKKLPKFNQSSTTVLVAPLGQQFQSKAMELVTMLRQENISSEMYLGEVLQPSTQLGYASRKGIPFVAILGENEITGNTISLKDMSTKIQVTVNEKEMLDILQHHSYHP